VTHPRLSSHTLAALPPEAAAPAYDRSAARGGVVHLGVGAFHRGHQAAVFDQILRAGDLDWAVRGVSLRSPEVRDRLAPQDGLYALQVLDGAEVQTRIIGALQDVVVAPQDPELVVERLADPAVHLATLTITEKGYHLDPATLELAWADPDIRHDLASPQASRTAPGLLAEALMRRRTRGLAPLTVLSCDNLPANGEGLRQAVLSLAGRRDPGLRDWIADAAAFPNSMVDRIVPATPPEALDGFAARFGVRDEALVGTEPFLQWVVEDRFAGRRPDLESAGVQLVGAVEPFETAKLRMLNGAHSAMAYLGGLAGVGFVHEFAAAPECARFVARLWDEIAPTIPPVRGLDLTAYRDELARRFRNAALQHRLRQIAMDGSRKLPQRLLAPLREAKARGLPTSALALAVGAWVRWQAGRDDAGAPLAPDDPAAAELRAAYASGASAPARVQAVLGAAGLLGPAPGGDALPLDEIAEALALLEQHGARSVLSIAGDRLAHAGRTR
jgi:fructuronate reductase